MPRFPATAVSGKVFYQRHTVIIYVGGSLKPLLHGQTPYILDQDFFNCLKGSKILYIHVDEDGAILKIVDRNGKIWKIVLEPVLDYVCDGECGSETCDECYEAFLGYDIISVGGKGND